MAGLYETGEARSAVYRAMAERVLSSLRAGLRTCAVFYGHPGIFVSPSHQMIEMARAEGFATEMLPGLSTEDCLAADLEIAAATIYRWRTQALVDAGVRPGTTSVQNAELIAARRRIRELESEVAILQRAATELRQVVHPKAASR